MKRAFNWLSIVGIVLALILLAGLHSPEPWYGSGSAQHDSKKRFSSFPVNQIRQVHVDWGDGSLEKGTGRQQQDQILDWLLITTVLSVARIASS